MKTVWSLRLAVLSWKCEEESALVVVMSDCLKRCHGVTDHFRSALWPLTWRVISACQLFCRPVTQAWDRLTNLYRKSSWLILKPAQHHLSLVSNIFLTLICQVPEFNHTFSNALDTMTVNIYTSSWSDFRDINLNTFLKIKH